MSGLNQAFAKRSYGQKVYRGFKSRPLRQQKIVKRDRPIARHKFKAFGERGRDLKGKARSPPKIVAGRLEVTKCSWASDLSSNLLEWDPLGLHLKRTGFAINKA